MWAVVWLCHFLYKSEITDFIVLSTWLRCSVFCKICFVCVTGMLQYMFVMSREANVEVGVMGICCGPWINV